jgi:uncharacterized protein
VSTYFFDSSALVKRYAQETGTHWVAGIAEPQAKNLLYIVRLTAVEVTAAIARRRRGKSLSPNDAASALAQFNYDLYNQYRVIEVSPQLLNTATGLADQYSLRGYDAVQFATSLTLHTQRRAMNLSDLILVSADKELNAAAQAEGLQIEDPNDH